MTAIRPTLLLATASLCAWGQPTCPSVNFLVARTVNLKPTPTTHLNVLQQSLGSYTAYEVTDSAPHRVIAVTPNFERQFASCLPHDLPAVPAEAQSPVASTSQLQASARVPSGELIASINGSPNVGRQSIQLDVFDRQFNLISETIFTSPNSGESFVSLALVDVNGDLKPDLIALSSAPSAVGHGQTVGALWSFIGNGDGTFQPGVNSPLPGTFPGVGYTSFAVADMNGDGKPDIAASSVTGATIAVGKGDGTFTVLPTSALPGLSSYSTIGAGSIAAADLNGDGKADLVLGPLNSFNPYVRGVAVAVGNGDGTFQPPIFLSARLNAAGLGANQIAIGDVNGDLIPDIVTAAGTILFGDGKGGFPSRRDYVSNAAGSVTLFDFDGDGKIDIIVGNGNPTLLSGNSTYPALTVLLGQGGGSFAGAPVADAGPESSPNVEQSIATADFNGDGIPDLAFADLEQESLTILKGAGNGEFSPVFHYVFPTSSSVNILPVSIAAADFNRDGKPDIAALVDAAPAAMQGAVQIFLGNGDGTLQAPLSFPLPAPNVSFIAAADLNGDGIPDIAATAQGGVWICLGRGDGTFTAPTTYAIPDATLASLAFGDFNRDGKLDIAVANQSAGAVEILLGRGDGTFTAGSMMPVSTMFPINGAPANLLGPGALIAQDLNDDGTLDLAVDLTNQYGATGGAIAILLGRGDGTFLGPVIDTEPAIAIASADINGDKIPDLVVTDLALGTVFRIGNGDGSFQPATPIVTSPLAEFAIADFNRDGTLDIAGGLFSSGVAALLNLSTPPPALTVVSAASFVQGPLAPDSIATAFGRNLALSGNRGGATVMVQDSTGATSLAQQYYASPTQINFVIPAATAVGAATVMITGPNGVRSSAQIQIEPLAPTLSTVGSAGIAAAYAIRVSPDGTQTVLPVFAATGSNITATPIDLSQPGSVYLLLFGTGFDAATAASTLVNIQGVLATVQYAGPNLTFQGFDQVSVILPPSLAGSGLVGVQTVIGGQPANRVFIDLQ